MTDTKTLEKKLATLADRLEGLVGEDGEFTSTKQLVDSLVSGLEEVKKNGINAKSVMEQLDELKAGQDRLVKQIRTSRKGFYVSGQEDVEFSILKAMVGVKTGDWSQAGQEKELMDQWAEQKAQIAGEGAAGRYFIADQTIADVIGAIYKRSQFINLSGDGTTRVSLLEGLTAGRVKVPKFDGGLIAYWIGEEDEYAESQAAVGDITMDPKKLGILVRITDEMRKYQDYGFENLLRQDMERKAAEKMDWTIAYGSGGDNMPRGIAATSGIKVYRAETGDVYTTQAGVNGVADWDGGELSFDGLDNMMLALEEDDITMDDSFALISSPRYFKRLKQLKITNFSGQTSDQPYLLGMPMLSEAKLREALGVDFASTTQIGSNLLPGYSVGGATDSTNQKYTDVFGGNMSQVVVGRWFGLEIEDDGGRGKGFTSDHTYMKLRMYADVAIRQNREIILCPDALARD